MINEAKKIDYELIQKNALKQLLLKNDSMLLQYLDDIICYDYDLINTIAALPMDYLSQDMWSTSKKKVLPIFWKQHTPDGLILMMIIF